MRHRLFVAARAFSLGFLAWMVLSVTVITPGWADDDDEGNTTTTSTSSTTSTSTTTSTTTTSTSTTTSTTSTTTTTNPTTTTTPLPTTTSTTTPAATPTTTAPTTTTLPRSTTTTTDAGAVAPPPPLPPPDVPESAATPVPADTHASLLADQSSLVISLSGDEGNPSQTGDADGRRHIDPLEGMEVAFHSAVETLKGQFLQAVILGLVVASLAVIGLDRRRGNWDLATSAA